MALTLSQSSTATSANGPASFGASGGTAPYVYSVLSGGAGGSINSSTGLYKGPALAPSSPQFSFDTIQVIDHVSATSTAQILVGTPLILLSDIIRSEMSLANDQIWIFDQKLNIPIDSRLYVNLAIKDCQPFASINAFVNGNQVQSVNMAATIDVDILSRGPEARDRKEEVVLALNSVYSEQQQEANSFVVLRLSERFINLSGIDGTAIPYRFSISFQMQYQVTKTKPAQYFDTFQTPQVVIDTP